jgi:hypothetical protein
MQIPDEGFRGYFVELTFAGETPLKVTSGIEILPTEYPFEPFVPSRVAAEAN